MTAKQATKRSKKKRVRKVRVGKVYIQSTYNNTLITVTDQEGDVLVSSSAGRIGYAGARKATPYAAQQVVAKVLEQLVPIGMSEAKIFVKGIGPARESAVRALAASELTINSIRDVTPIPHNGVRAPKRRRV